MCRPLRSVITISEFWISSCLMRPVSWTKTTCRPSGANEGRLLSGQAGGLALQTRVSGRCPVPSGLTSQIEHTNFAQRVKTISLPSGDQCGWLSKRALAEWDTRCSPEPSWFAT